MTQIFGMSHSLSSKKADALWNVLARKNHPLPADDGSGD